jgi:ribosomal protein S18 acetylase RimI-like enzyme
MTDSNELDRKLLGYLRASAQRSPSGERSGAFVVTFNREDDNPYLNYAIPDDGADPTPSDIAALIAVFEKRQRKPRLEYMPGAVPKLEAALLAQGFKAEARVPVMLCTPTMQIVMPETAGLHVLAASTGEDLTAAELSQAEAYDSPSHGPAGLKRTLKLGGVVAAARDIASGMVIGAGVATPPLEGVTEIAGIGVRPTYRRRGAAGAMTALLTQEAFAKGITLAWLTPGSVEAERIYARAGYVVASEALHISR